MKFTEQRGRAFLIALAAVMLVGLLYSTTRHATSPSEASKPTPEEQAARAAADIDAIINQARPRPPASPLTTAPVTIPAVPVDLSAEINQLGLLYSHYLIGKYCADQGYSFESADLDHLQSSAQAIEGEMNDATASQQAYQGAQNLVQPYLTSLSNMLPGFRAVECYNNMQADLPYLGRPGVQMDEQRPF